MTCTWRAAKPTSSSASRKAVACMLASSGSTLPPGKAICPEWVFMCAARRVSNTVGDEACGPLITMGTSTAAWAGARSEVKLSRTTSGCHTGGCSNRAFRASGCKKAVGTAGMSWSICQTGTCRGSNSGFLDTVGLYNRQGHARWRGTGGGLGPSAQRPGRKMSGLPYLATLLVLHIWIQVIS